VTPPAPPPFGPRLSVQIDFVNDIRGDPVTPEWTELGALVRGESGFSITRGRQRALDRNETGTATVTFDNSDGAFDPENYLSPFFPFVIPGRRMRISALTRTDTTPFVCGSSDVGGTDTQGGGPDDVYTSMFDGITDAWTYDYPQRGFDAVATVQALDALASLAQGQLSGVDVYGYAPDAIAATLDTTDTYTPREPRLDVDRDQSLATEGTHLVSLVVSSGSPLDAISLVSNSDGGNFFVGRDGRYVYRGPDADVNSEERSITVDRATQPFVDVAFVYDSASIFNDIIANPTYPSLFPVRLQDTDSIRTFGQRALVEDNCLGLQTDLEDHVTRKLAKHSEPQRVVQMLDLSMLPVDWAKVLSLDLWDKIPLTVELPDGRSVFQTSLIEGIEIAAPTSTSWRIIWWLSRAPWRNLLDADQSGFEGATILGWQAGPNTTIKLSSEVTDDELGGLVWHPGPHPSSAGHFIRPSWLVPPVLRGRGSLALLPIDPDEISAETDPVAVSAGGRYTATVHTVIAASAQVQEPGRKTTGYLNHLEIDWVDGAGGIISSIGSTPVTLAFRRSGAVIYVYVPDLGFVGRAAPWNLLTVTGRAPVGAVAMVLRAVSDAEITPHFIDQVSIFRTG
ncbi:MAG: hypothetical protein ACRDH7_07455, partial [Actinomycetota bacterium]